METHPISKQRAGALALSAILAMVMATLMATAGGISVSAAQTPGADMPVTVPSVSVPGTREPVDKSYRKMVRGMDRYAQARALAPQSSLRFQLLPRQPGVQLDGVVLKVVGDSIALPVPLAPDHSFTPERNAQAWREDAALLANRRTSSMTWRALVRSTGVPEGMRRLGDLRLECLVGVEAGLVSNNAALFGWLADMLSDADTVCAAPDGNYLQFADKPLFGVTLHAGTRTMALPLRSLYAGGTQTAATLPYCDCQVLLDRSYYAPIWDRSWPDDTLLSFDYMDGDAQAAIPPGVASKAAARAALGEPAAAQRFDSGYEVWQYRYPPAADLPRAQDGSASMAELLLLFDAGGATKKYRRREPWQPWCGGLRTAC